MPTDPLPARLDELDTPCLILDAARVHRNVERLYARLQPMGVTLRPHLKTAKSADVAQIVADGPHGPVTVSTLKEAEYFAEAGFLDLLYAVGIAPSRLDRIGQIRVSHGADLAVILDSAEQARAVAHWSRAHHDALPAMIEIDADGHRSGVAPGDTERLVEIGRILHDGGAELRGVVAHAGESYALSDPKALAAAAEQERAETVRAADALRAAGLPCPVVSVGSTPTAFAAGSLEGVTEMRPGVFCFFDLFQAGVGVCDVDDIALSVLATVIGHQKDRGWIITDSGWMAMSRDRGTAAQAVDQGYGMVCDLDGHPYPDLILRDANQEHGIAALREGSGATLPDLPIGAKVRILPNHACATGAQHDRYHVVDSASDPTAVRAVWPRINGW